MKLLYIPFFIIQFLNINADSEPVVNEDQQVRKVDCNDTGVLAAVDFTLRKFNVEHGAGNKFALYRVIDADQDEHESKYYVTFTIYETDCPNESEKSWKDCNYKEPKNALSAKCTSHVVLNRLQRINKVTTYNCTLPDHHNWIFPKKAPCVGCEHFLPTNHSIVNKASAHAIKIFNSNSTYNNYFRVATVYNLTHQVVAGIKYTMTFLNQETECSKDQSLDYEGVTACPFKAEGTKLFCATTLLEQVWMNHTSASVSCHSEAPEQALFGFGGWGPFLVNRLQVNSAEGLHSSSETPESAEAHDLSTCPGEPWKPLHQVKPAPPPADDHHDSQEETTVT